MSWTGGTKKTTQRKAGSRNEANFVMKRFWSGRAGSIKPYVAGEQPAGGGIIKLNTNENPYPPSPAIEEALANIQAEKHRLYPDPSCFELRSAIAQTHNVSVEEVFAGNGSDEILAFAFAAFFEPDGKAPPVLFPDITYSFYPVYAALWNIDFKEAALGKDWRVRKEDYFVESGGVVLANPNAPTGIALASKDIAEIAEAQKKYGALVIADEAYSDFSGQSMIEYLSKHGGGENILSVRTFSKSYSLAGLRLGYAVGNPSLIEALCRIKDSFNSYTVDYITQAAGRAAMLDRAYFEFTRDKIIETRKRLSSELVNMGFETLPSDANFVFTRCPGLSGADFFAALRGGGVLVRHFDKNRVKDFVRVTIGKEEDMDIFLDLCKKIACKSQKSMF